MTDDEAGRFIRCQRSIGDVQAEFAFELVLLGVRTLRYMHDAVIIECEGDAPGTEQWLHT